MGAHVLIAGKRRERWAAPESFRMLMRGKRILGGGPRQGMKAVLQRVLRASVTVDDRIVGEIGRGLLVLLCAEPGDGDKEAAYLAGKIARMRIFADDSGKFNRSLLDVEGGALVISQFTLTADWRRGNRPSFSGAATPESAIPLYEGFCGHLRALGVAVQMGEFATHMEVALINDGPVTIWMDTRDR